MPTVYPGSYDDNTSMPTKVDGDLISASADATQIGAIKKLETRVGITGTEPFINPLLAPYSADNTGAVEATSALQAAHDAASDGDTILLRKGTYLIDKLNWTKKVNIVGAGTPEEVVLKAKSGATGPLLNVAFGALKHHLRLENFYIDMQLATGQVGLYLNNLDLATISNVKVREGTVGFDIDSVAASDFNQCWAFNSRTAGFRSKNAAAIDNTYNRCFVYMTPGALANMNVGFDIQAGGSNYLNGVRVLRSPGNTFFMPYGIKCDSALTTDWLFLNNVVVDGVTDGSGANSATSAGLYLKDCTGVFSSNSFYSANDTSGQKQRGVRIDGGSRLSFTSGRISGSGLEFANTVDNVTVHGVDFPAAYSDAALNFGSSTVTNLDLKIAPPGAAVSDNALKLSTATTKVTGDMLALVPSTRPNVNSLLAWTEDPLMHSSNKTPTGATIYLRKIMVPTTIPIANLLITLSTNGTSYTNTQLAVYNSSGTLIGASAVLASAGTNTFGSGATAVKSVPIVVIGGQSLTVTGSDTAFVWAAIHMGTNASTSCTFVGSATGVAQTNALAAVGVSRAGTYTGHVTNDLATIGNITPASISQSAPLNIWFGVT